MMRSGRPARRSRSAGLSGITNTTLTRALRELEADGLVHREQFNKIPPHVEYSFTDAGRDLMPVFYEIMRWGFKHDVGFDGIGSARRAPVPAQDKAGRAEEVSLAPSHMGV